MEAPKLLNEVMHQNEELLAQRPELGATLAGEVRLLRSINTIVISEMTAQLDRGYETCIAVGNGADRRQA